jgi:hypothetical protein
MVARKPGADRTVNVVLYDSDYGFAMNVFKNLYLGPGEPGPGDEWKCPAGPVDEGDIEDAAMLDRVRGESPDDPTARG